MKNTLLLLVAAASLLLFSGCAETAKVARSGGGGPSAKYAKPVLPQPGEYKLGKGDTVVIHLQGNNDPKTVEDIVDARGMITLPLIDEVQASGRTTREIEAAIKGAYVPDYYRNMNVTLLVPSKSRRVASTSSPIMKT